MTIPSRIRFPVRLVCNVAGRRLKWGVNYSAYLNDGLRIFVTARKTWPSTETRKLTRKYFIINSIRFNYIHLTFNQILFFFFSSCFVLITVRRFAHLYHELIVVNYLAGIYISCVTRSIIFYKPYGNPIQTDLWRKLNFPFWPSASAALAIHRCLWADACLS